MHPQKIAKLEPSKTKCIAIKFGSTIAFTISFVLKISREKLSFVTFAFSSSFCRLIKTWVINKKQLLRVWQKFAGPQDTQAQWKCHRTNTNSKITAFCIRWVQFSHNIPCFLLPKPNPNPPPPPPPYPKFYMITIVLNYPYGDFNTQEKLQNKGYAKIGGANKVYYGRCANWLFYQYHLSKGKVYLSQSTFSRPHLERRVYWILTSPLTLFLIW